MKKIICLIIILIVIGAEASSKYYYATAKTEFNLNLPVKNVSADNESSATTQENSSDNAKSLEKVLSDDEKNNEKIPKKLKMLMMLKKPITPITLITLTLLTLLKPL